MNVSVSLVKDLRKKTGAGMMDCKKSLVATSGNFEAAIDLLKVKGLANAAKKSERVVSEGLTALIVESSNAAVIEINSETDFVSRNKIFQSLVNKTVKKAINCSSLEQLKSCIVEGDKTVQELTVENMAIIGENLTISRMKTIKVTEGVIASYVHNSIADGMGQISVLVALESSGSKERLMELGKQIAMHIAAAKPLFLNKEDVDKKLIQRERDVFTKQSIASGKPNNIIEKMIDGRIRKFLEEIVLFDQVFVIDTSLKISEVIENVAKELGVPIVLTNYARFELGEGSIKKDKKEEPPIC